MSISLIEQIKNDINNARKRNKKKRISILSTLYGEAVAIGKNKGNRGSTDQEVIKVITKFIKNNTDTINLIKKKDGVYNPVLKFENKLLSKYLPKQMTDTELKDAIVGIVSSVGASSPRDMGKVMKELKAAHGGLYDGRTASSLVKDVLNGK